MRLLLTFILFLFTATVVMAQDNPLKITFYGSFLHSDKVPNTLFFFSEIKKNDSFELRKAIRNHNIDTMVLSSGGGLVSDGLLMAGIIHDKELTTYVPKKGLDGPGDCASACSFMFFGGKVRIISGKLGVHQFYSNSSEKNANISKVEKGTLYTASEIIGFLNEFKTPPFVFEKMFQQSGMYYFNKKEITKLENNNSFFTDKKIQTIENFITDLVIHLNHSENISIAKKPEKLIVPKPTVKKKQCYEDTKICTNTQICGFATIGSANLKRWRPTQYSKKFITEAKRRGLYCGVKYKTKTKTKNETVRSIQSRLNKLGCNAGKADGILGPKTLLALNRWKARGGLYTVNKIDKSLQNALWSTSVKCLQKNSSTSDSADGFTYISCKQNSISDGTVNTNKLFYKDFLGAYSIANKGVWVLDAQKKWQKLGAFSYLKNSDMYLSFNDGVKRELIYNPKTRKARSYVFSDGRTFSASYLCEKQRN